MPGAVRRHWPLAAICAALLLAWQPVFTGPAERYNSEVLTSAIAIYAILRSINAALSVAKEIEVGASFVGSVTGQPGMLLDPLDETVARVADAIFLLAVTSGVLKIAFGPLSQLGALAAAAGFACLYAARLGIGPPRLASATRPLVTVGLILALALPLAYGAGGRIGDIATAPALAEAQETLEGSAESLREDVEQGAAAQAEGQGGDWRPWARIGEALPDMDHVQTRGGEILESSITLVAIYAFRLIVLPLALAWATLAVARRMLR